MARPFYYLPAPHPRLRGRPPQPVALLLILVLAALAAVWMNLPPVASILPVHPPG
ncbi:MAG TPA: hypothetical protein VGM25_18200 [Caulobacteraceae bacterium]|jgi:hypothetical protein